MQPLRGTKDILPEEMKNWYHICEVAKNILNLHSYSEIQTPIIENTELFQRSIGYLTDIVNKEMYSFVDQGDRSITLRPEGTASIARAAISNKLYMKNKTNRLWYIGPMFRYERPQKGRQRQFHQLGIELIGSNNPTADVEVIKVANSIIKQLYLKEQCKMEINCIGDAEDREKYSKDLIDYLNKYKKDLDIDSQRRINKNPLRILDSKIQKTQEILKEGPILKHYLKKNSIAHFDEILSQLKHLNIEYKINEYLVRGLDYYNYTAFEIKTEKHSNQNTICGGGRYDNLINQLGGPNIPAIGCAIGIERILELMDKGKNLYDISKGVIVYIVTQYIKSKEKNFIWDVVNLLEEYKIRFEIDLSNNTLSKQLKKASQKQTKICFILGEEEINKRYITIKWLTTKTQQSISFSNLKNYLNYIKKL